MSTADLGHVSVVDTATADGFEETPTENVGEPQTMLPSVPAFPGPFTPGRPARAPSMPNGLLSGEFEADTVLDGGQVLGGVVRAASVRGTSHRWDNEPRQDAMLVGRVEVEWGEAAVLVVADGVGNAAHSDRGSAIGVKAAMDSARHLIQEWADPGTVDVDQFARRVMDVASEAIASEAHERQVSPAEFATTLCLAVLVRGETGTVRAWVCGVGDSGHRTLRRGAFDVLDGTEEIQDTLTAALPSTSVPTVTSVDLLPGDCLVLATDGVLNLLLDQERSARFASQLSVSPDMGLAHYLWVIDASVRSFDDDRTAVCFWAGSAR